MCSRRRTESGYSASWWSPCCRSSWRNARHLPHGRSRAGDRHLNFYETRDNLAVAESAEQAQQLFRRQQVEQHQRIGLLGRLVIIHTVVFGFQDAVESLNVSVPLAIVLPIQFREVRIAF